MSPLLADERLRVAQQELDDSVRDGRARDAAAWQIAVAVLAHYAGRGPEPAQPSLRS